MVPPSQIHSYMDIGNVLLGLCQKKYEEMTMYSFLMLTNEEQWHYLWDKGDHIENYKSIDCSFSLYGVNTFFVEVELCPTTGKIIGKSVFKEGKKLEKYFF